MCLHGQGDLQPPKTTEDRQASAEERLIRKYGSSHKERVWKPEGHGQKLRQIFQEEKLPRLGRPSGEGPVLSVQRGQTKTWCLRLFDSLNVWRGASVRPSRGRKLRSLVKNWKWQRSLSLCQRRSGSTTNPLTYIRRYSCLIEVSFWTSGSSPFTWPASAQAAPTALGQQGLLA